MGKPFVFRRPWDRSALRGAHKRTAPVIPSGTGIGSSNGTASVSGVGTAVGAGVGSSDGTSTATAVGLIAGAGSSDGTSAATGIGASTAAGVGASAGVATLSGISSTVYGKTSGAWLSRDSSKFSVNRSGVWVTPLMVFARVNGTWRQV